MKKETIERKDVAKAYAAYAKTFTPKPACLRNTIKAFVAGGAICAVAYYGQNLLCAKGFDVETAGTVITLAIIAVAQLLTGLGIFDRIAKFAGAGVVVPISGFANAMVAPAIEYKREGPVLGAGAKMFTIAGPVLVWGISSATIVGVLYWVIGLL